MSAHDNGGPAFPRALPTGKFSPDECLRIIDAHAGMSRRDYFAAKAMQGAIAAGPATVSWVVESGRKRHGSTLTPDQAMAFACYDMADAMLEASGQ